MNQSSDPIRVLIAHYLPNTISGAELSITDLVDKMDPRFECVMLTPGEGKLSEFYRKKGFTVWTDLIQTRRKMYPGLHFIQSQLFSQKLKRHNIQAVICNTFPAASRVATAARFSGLPYGIYVREYIADIPLHRRILAQANQVFAISKDLQGYLSLMTDPAKIQLTYNHINPNPILKRVRDHRKRGRRILPFSEKYPVIGIVGRITPFKQQDLFIKAIPMVLASYPDARFVVVGAAREKEKDYENYVRELAQKLGVAEKVCFLGARQDSIEITSELAISCLTSTREPLGRVILEAHLVGCPVVVASTGGPAEIVEDGVTGMIFGSVASDAKEQLARKIIDLLNNPTLRQELASTAQQRIFDTFASMEPVHIQEHFIESLAEMRQQVSVAS